MRDPNGDGGGDPNKGATPKADDPPKGDDVSALKARLAELETAAQARADADRKAQEAEAKKRGDFEKLLADKDATIERLSALEKREAARVKALGERMEAKIKTLPKDRQSLIPAILKADPDALAEFVETNWTILSGQPAGESTDKPKSTPAGEMTDDKVPADIKAEAQRRGMTPLAWYNILLKAGRIKPAATA